MNTSERTAQGQFKPGTSGNPAGRPLGSRNRSTLLTQLLDAYGEQLIEKAAEMAMEGDARTMAVLIQRILPARRERFIEIDIPPGFNLKELQAKPEFILRGVLEGKLTIEEGERLHNILQKQTSITEVTDLQRRVAELEGRGADQGKFDQETKALIQSFAFDAQKRIDEGRDK